MVLPPYGARDVFFRLHGTLRPGTDTISVKARSVVSARGQSGSVVSVGSPAEFDLGIVTHEYPHIPSQQFVRFSQVRLEVVDARVPARLNVAYVKGTEDLQTAFGQLQVKTKLLDPSLLAVVDLSSFSTVLIGAGALANDALATAVPALQDFARKGGTVVLLRGRSEIAERGGCSPTPSRSTARLA